MNEFLNKDGYTSLHILVEACSFPRIFAFHCSYLWLVLFSSWRHSFSIKLLRRNKWASRKEKSLSQVAMVAKVNLCCFKLHLICQMLAKFSEVESKRNVFKFRKRKSNFLCCFYLLRKTYAWNWEVSCGIRATTAKKGTKKRYAYTVSSL